MAASESVTASEYVAHHLRHYASASQHGLFDPSVIHYDTLGFSLLTGTVVVIVLRLAAVRATAGVPSRFQALVEMLVEFVDEQSKAVISVDRAYAAPLALTLFCWVTLMNAIDLIPVDLIPRVAGWFGVDHLRPLPTADLNATLGMALGVLVLSLYYGIKTKGLFGFVKELFIAPFGQTHLSLNPLTWISALLLAAADFGLNIIEYVSKTFSMGMRLYGNMYAGELLFFLIALLGGSFTLFGVALNLVIGTVWALYHVLIDPAAGIHLHDADARYIGQAEESHAAH